MKEFRCNYCGKELPEAPDYVYCAVGQEDVCEGKAYCLDCYDDETGLCQHCTDKSPATHKQVEDLHKIILELRQDCIRTPCIPDQHLRSKMMD